MAARLNPKDDESYAYASWLEATCQDPKVHDAKDAIAKAKKACKLSRWQRWGFISILATAYAELGDFDQAIKYEKQAMAVGSPSESDRQESQKRISSYEEREPYRQ